MTVFGHVLCQDGTSAADQAVTIYQRRRMAGGAGFAMVGTASTEADGSYQLTPLAFDTNSAFYAASAGARSPHVQVKVAAQVTLSGSPGAGQLFTRGGSRGASAHNTVTFTGRVSPGDAGATVALQRESAAGNEEWRRIALGQVDEQGAYSITHTFAAPGEANIRVVVRLGGLALPGASEPLAYQISTRQNPQLTIHASANPISYGQPVTISGVLAGAVEEPVTLLARTRRGAFATVARGTTDGSGNYAFTQSPQQNTIYRVTHARTWSVGLSEGVKYALDTTPPASIVEAGAPLTLSGTVAPAHAGQTVFLQRQNASGIGFHVVDAGTVSSASTYSFIRAFEGAGTSVLRVKVAGDWQNQGAAGPASKIEVTPAPAAALTTEAPGDPLSG